VTTKNVYGESRVEKREAMCGSLCVWYDGVDWLFSGVPLSSPYLRSYKK